ncbi:MAG: FlgD immunoglobulin-like domain containing protein, partial [bacterium]
VGSSAGGVASLKSYDPGEVPPGTTCHFYGIKGPTNPLAVRQNRSLPETFTLEQNYPNPFNPETTIRFHLPEAAGTTLAIYNLLGQKVRTLVHGTLAAGRYSVKWDGRDERRLQVPSGGYVFELRATGFVQRRKMLLVR